MRTIRTKVFNFNELSNEAKQKAIEQNRDINTDYDWFNDTIESFVEKLNEVGFYDAEVYFSGFHSQGDGACFDAKIEPLKFAETLNEKRVSKLIDAGILENFTINKTSFSNHYSHEKTRYVDVWEDNRTNINNTLISLCEKIEAERLRLSKDIYNLLYKEYEYLQSDNVIIETIEANGYEFLKSGKQI